MAELYSTGARQSKIYSIRMQSNAEEILQHYFKADAKPDYLLPVLSKGDCPATVKKRTLQAIKTTNKYLVEIAKKSGITVDITTYYARYTWANICKSFGYSKDLIAESLEHSYCNAVSCRWLQHQLTIWLSSCFHSPTLISFPFLILEKENLSVITVVLVFGKK